MLTLDRERFLDVPMAADVMDAAAEMWIKQGPLAVQTLAIALHVIEPSFICLAILGEDQNGCG
jgi:hypothetical protein